MHGVEQTTTGGANIGVLRCGCVISVEQLLQWVWGRSVQRIRQWADQREKGHAFAALRADAFEDSKAVHSRGTSRFVQQPGLADAHLAADEQKSRRAREGVGNEREFRSPTDDRANARW